MTAGRILVTGGAGYLGSLLVHALVHRGHRVRVFDKLIFGESGLASIRDRIELMPGDIFRPPDRLMRDVVAVVHLAGLSSQSTASYRSPRYTDRVNHIGTEIIARLARAHEVPRFVFASSCSIYCTTVHTASAIPPTWKEEDSLNVWAPYALSKRAAEEALLELADRRFQPILLRKGTLYGYSAKMRYDLVVNAFAKDAYSRRRISVNAAGEMYRPFLDIQDAVASYLAALELPLELVGGQTFNVVSSNRRIIDVAEDVRRILKRRKGIDVELDVKPFEPVLSYQADDSKFREIFNLDPARSLEDAVLEIWDVLERGEDYTDPRYYNDAWHDEAQRRGLLQ